ncbi:glutathione S-transferase [Prochlorococcus marinus]|uniref:Glutathione S-transferase n=1 Tax=Prochlorococcus marinus XMU1408 TaxID=2213228 RepID=A0A318R5H8_PROMR|nr:glutathione S-transferase [Prochlorococcus marinus]MBW3041658.1 glutathione S-transferase [Prochlorococcus marinus str. XMU1408]PYE02811.1 glutathione S-transferase [Prochlorococcus marinus XMU1408]
MKHNILYSFRRCPYAIRARWALLNTNQLVELREVDLKKKPIELIEISKKATVPVLKTSLNQVIDESIDIMIWSLKESNMDALLFKNCKSQEILSLIDLNDKEFKYHLDRYKYASRFNYQELKTHRDACYEILLSLNNRLKSFSNKGKPLFLVDAKESIADWAIWPFIRQFRIADISRFDQNHEIEFLRNWLNYFLNHEKYHIVMKKNKPWDKESKPIFFGQ